MRKRPLTSRYRAPAASSTTLAVAIGPSRTASSAPPAGTLVREGAGRTNNTMATSAGTAPDERGSAERYQQQVTQRHRNQRPPCTESWNQKLRRQQRCH